MIASLQIENFRNFQNLRIESFGNVNLIVGKNNTGKSNLLEAISLYAAGGDFYRLLSILVYRNELLETTTLTGEKIWMPRETNLEAYASLFYGRKVHEIYNPAIWICEIDNHEQSLKMNVSYFREDKRLGVFVKITENDLNKNHRVDLNNRGFSIEYEKEKAYICMRNLGAQADPVWSNYSFSENACSHHVFSGMRAYEEESPKIWDSIALSKKEDYLKDALQLINPEITGFTYKSSNNGKRIPYVRVADEIVPVGALGEGVDHVISLILHLVASENGTLCVDEIENGFHYSLMDSLWSLIFKLAKKLNVQVFATTHSGDCARAFAAIAAENADESDARIIRLQQHRMPPVMIYDKESIARSARLDMESEVR